MNRRRFVSAAVSVTGVAAFGALPQAGAQVATDPGASDRAGWTGRAVQVFGPVLRALAAGRLKQHEAAPLIELLGAHHRDEDPAGSR